MSKNNCPLNYTMGLIGLNGAFGFISFIRRSFTVRMLQKKSEISNKMFTQTVRELEKDGLISRKVFPVVPLKSNMN
jgi:DNA-binding HxlR family transcriptional regulator